MISIFLIGIELFREFQELNFLETTEIEMQIICRTSLESIF